MDIKIDEAYKNMLKSEFDYYSLEYYKILNFYLDENFTYTTKYSNIKEFWDIFVKLKDLENKIETLNVT